MGKLYLHENDLELQESTFHISNSEDNEEPLAMFVTEEMVNDTLNNDLRVYPMSISRRHKDGGLVLERCWAHVTTRPAQACMY